MDPRVKASPEDLRAQFQAEMKIANDMHRDFEALEQVKALRSKLQEAAKSAKAPALVKATDEKAALIEGTPGGYGAQYLSTPEARGLARLNSGFGSLLAIVQSADAAPTTQAIAMLSELEKALDEQLTKWKELQAQDLPALNKALKQAKLATITIPSPGDLPASGEMHSQHQDLE
jgi:hypothetical protein